MKKTFTLIVILLLSGTSALFSARYKFDYDLISDIRKTYVLLYKFRLYYHASASAYFNSAKTSKGQQQFRFSGFPDNGYRIRTHRRGSKLSVVTAATSFARARKDYPRRIASFRKEAPFYSRMIKTIARRPFRILPAGADAIRFSRSLSGKYSSFKLGIKMVKPSSMSRYNDSFNIYKLLVEMIKIMNHNYLPGKGLASLPATGKTWKSPWLNYGRAFSRISLLADYKGRKHFKYRQKHSFIITYRVVSRKNGTITIVGSGRPFIRIGMGMQVRKITRSIVIRKRDGLLISDRFSMDAKNSKRLGWTLRSRLRLL